MKILWDISLSMEKSRLEMELSYLQSFFKQIGNVEVAFQTFGYRNGEERKFNINNGRWGALKEHIMDIDYDGAVSTGAVQQLKTNNFTLLFTDGKDFDEDMYRNWQGRVFVINSQTSAKHELLMSIADETGGDYIDLSRRFDPKRSADYRRMQGNYVSSTTGGTLLKPIVVKGSVSDFEDPIYNVSVRIKGTDKTVNTDREGNFKITALAGDVLQFSYPGRQSTEAVINSGNPPLNITMPLGTNVLDEVVLTKDTKLDAYSAPLYDNIVTNNGDLDPNSTGFSIKQIEGDKLNMASTSILDVIQGKFPGVEIVGTGVLLRRGTLRTAAWDVDGLVYGSGSPPQDIIIQNIKSITIMQPAWAATRYGMIAGGGIIIVRTNNDQRITEEARGKEESEHQNMYAGEAVFPEKEVWRLESYLQAMERVENEEQAYNTYLEQRNSWGNKVEFYVDIYQYFKQKWPLSEKAGLILSNLRELNPGNINSLRLLAFLYDENGEWEKALEVYKEIQNTDPDQFQSLRDLAHAQVQNRDFTAGWRQYDLYLKKRNDSLSTEGLDKIVRQEMLELVEKHHEEIQVDQQYFDLEIEKEDISIIVQWNNPNAEFELQFVGPTGQYYTWKHTEAQNWELLSKERSEGAYSKSFSIFDIGEGPWMINTKYYGNKEGSATYLKFTINNHLQKTRSTRVIELKKRDVNYRSLNISQDQVESLFR